MPSRPNGLEFMTLPWRECDRAASGFGRHDAGVKLYHPHPLTLRGLARAMGHLDRLGRGGAPARQPDPRLWSAADTQKKVCRALGGRR